MHIQRRVSAELSPYQHQDVLTDCNEVVVRHGMGMETIFAETERVEIKSAGTDEDYTIRYEMLF